MTIGYEGLKQVEAVFASFCAGISDRLVVYAGCLKITVLIVVNMQNASN